MLGAGCAQVLGAVEQAGERVQGGLTREWGHEEEGGWRGCPGCLPCLDCQCPVFQETVGWPGHHLTAPTGLELLSFYSDPGPGI